MLSFVCGIFRVRRNVLWSDLLVPCIFIDSASLTMLSLTNCSSSLMTMLFVYIVDNLFVYKLFVYIDDNVVYY